MSQSPELGGGEGFTYEGNAAAFYLCALLDRAYAPGIDDRIVVRVSVQQRNFGEPLDDVIVDFQDVTSGLARLSLQVKRSLTISKAKNNVDFREVIRDSWATFNKADFRKDTDRYGAAIGSIAYEKERGLKTLCDLARASLTTSHFDTRFATGGGASKEVKKIRDDVAALLAETKGSACTNEELHQFFAHFVLIRFDFLREGSVHPPEAINRIKHCLAPADAAKAPLVWSRFVENARRSAGTAGQFDRVGLICSIRPIVALRDDLLDRFPQLTFPVQGIAAVPVQKAHELLAMLETRDYPRTLLKRIYFQSQLRGDLRMADAKTEDWLFDLEDSRAQGFGYPGPLIEFAERLGREKEDPELCQWAKRQCELGEYGQLADKLDGEKEREKPMVNLFIEIASDRAERLSWWLEGEEFGATGKQHLPVSAHTLRKALEDSLPTIIGDAEAQVGRRFILRVGFIVPAELFLAGLESVQVACPDEPYPYVLNTQFPVLYHWNIRAQGKLGRYLIPWEDILKRVRRIIKQCGNTAVHWLQDATDQGDIARFAQASQELLSGPKGAVCLGIDELPQVRFETIVECLKQGVPCLFWLARPAAPEEAETLRTHVGLAFASHTPVRAPLSVWQQQQAFRADQKVRQLVWDLPDFLPNHSPTQSRFEEHS